MQLQLPTVEDLREVASSKQARRIEREWARLKVGRTKPYRYLHGPPKKMQ